MTGNFQTVFVFYDTVGRSPAYFALTFAGAALLAAGFISTLVRLCRKDAFFRLYVLRGKERWLPQILLFVAGSLLFVLSQALIVPPRKLDEMYRSQKYRVTEGLVHVLHVQPADGHDFGDVISVNGEEFEIQYYRVANTYTTTITHGGRLTEGAYVRLFWFYDGEQKEILRVDVDPRRSRDLPLPAEATDHSRHRCRGKRN